MSGTVELLSNQSAVPLKYCVRFSDTGHLFQSFATQPFADFGQRDSLRISETYSLGQMRSQDAVLCSQIFILQQQLLVHQPGYIR